MGKTKRIIAAVMAALMTMSSSALIPANAVNETVNVSLQSVSENESKEYTFNEINAMTTEDVVNLFTEKGLNKDNGYKVYGQGNDAEYVYCFSWNVYLFSEDFLSNRTVEEILTDYAPPQDGDCLYDKGESLWDTDRIVSALALYGIMIINGLEMQQLHIDRNINYIPYKNETDNEIKKHEEMINDNYKQIYDMINGAKKIWGDNI